MNDVHREVDHLHAGPTMYCAHLVVTPPPPKVFAKPTIDLDDVGYQVFIWFTLSGFPHYPGSYCSGNCNIWGYYAYQNPWGACRYKVPNASHRGNWAWEMYHASLHYSKYGGSEPTESDVGGIPPAPPRCSCSQSAILFPGNGQSRSWAGSVNSAMMNSPVVWSIAASP